MTLVKTRDLMDQAAQAHIGVAAFSVITLEHAEAIAARAQAAAAPVILHAMAPNLGRGACEALLDADTLVVALSQARHIEGGLAHYDAARRPATRGVVRRARLLNRISTATRTTRIRDAALTALARSHPYSTGCRPAVRRAALVPTKCR